MKNRAPLVVFDVRPLQCGYAQRGIGRYTRELLRALQARLAEKPARYRLRSLAFRGDLPPEVPVPIFFAPPWERVWLWDQAVLPWRLNFNHVALFQSCAAMGPLKEVNFPAFFAARSVLTVHDWHMWADAATPLERFYRSTRRLRWQKKFLPQAAQVVADAAFVAEETGRRAGVTPEKISVIPPGGDHLDAVIEKTSAATGFVLSIGDGPHKGLDTAYRALCRARADGFDREWLVIGDPQRVRACLPTKDPLPDWIRIRSNPEDAELKGLYRAALCLLFPSRREGFGFPVLEALRLGCPVLAANVEPLRSLIDRPECLRSPADAEGFADALRRLAVDAEERAASVAAGVLRAVEFTWGKSADRLLELWNRLLA